ncbi:Uncharacterised protein [Yersinia mollaretii]|nr:Uncharacterised protein [Yersinia mollaretii]
MEQGVENYHTKSARMDSLLVELMGIEKLR